MTKDYLFEIGTEEMPAHVVSKSVKQLADRTKKYLKENGLSFKDIKTYNILICNIRSIVIISTSYS